MVRNAGFARLPLALALSAGSLVAGCGASPSTQVNKASQPGLLAWDAHQSDLFDDNIDPVAVGLSLEGPSPRSDPFLRERAQTAELVARVRVSTVTVDSVGEQSTFHLGVQVGYPALAASRLEDRTFELHIRPQSRAAGIARSFDSRLRGLTFIAFIRRFAGEPGEPEMHWHLSPDTAEIAAAIKEAVALGELSAP